MFYGDSRGIGSVLLACSGSGAGHGGEGNGGGFELLLAWFPSCCERGVSLNMGWWMRGRHCVPEEDGQEFMSGNVISFHICFENGLHMRL